MVENNIECRGKGRHFTD